MDIESKINIALTVAQILAVSAIPVILWFFEKKRQNRKQKNDAKMQLFLSLMANRKPYFTNKYRLDALNTIDVVFQDNQKVKKAYNEYFLSIHSGHPNYVTQNTHLLDLLNEMAKSFGYDDLSQYEIDRYFFPKMDQEYAESVLKASKQESPDGNQQDNKEPSPPNEDIVPNS